MTSIVEDEGGDEGEDKIEKIEDSYKEDGQLWYKVKWAGETKASWEPASFLENVQNASRLMTAYDLENRQISPASNGSSTRSGS
jgi:hypothetical protein